MSTKNERNVGQNIKPESKASRWRERVQPLKRLAVGIGLILGGTLALRDKASAADVDSSPKLSNVVDSPRAATIPTEILASLQEQQEQGVEIAAVPVLSAEPTMLLPTPVEVSPESDTFREIANLAGITDPELLETLFISALEYNEYDFDQKEIYLVTAPGLTEYYGFTPDESGEDGTFARLDGNPQSIQRFLGIRQSILVKKSDVYRWDTPEDAVANKTPLDRSIDTSTRLTVLGYTQLDDLSFYVIPGESEGDVDYVKDVDDGRFTKSSNLEDYRVRAEEEITEDSQGQTDTEPDVEVVRDRVENYPVLPEGFDEDITLVVGNRVENNPSYQAWIDSNPDILNRAAEYFQQPGLLDKTSISPDGLEIIMRVFGCYEMNNQVLNFNVPMCVGAWEGENGKVFLVLYELGFHGHPIYSFAEYNEAGELNQRTNNSAGVDDVQRSLSQGDYLRLSNRGNTDRWRSVQSASLLGLANTSRSEEPFIPTSDVMDLGTKRVDVQNGVWWSQQLTVSPNADFLS